MADELIDLFWAEAPAAWETYENAMRKGVTSESTVTIVDIPTGNTVRQYETASDIVWPAARHSVSEDGKHSAKLMNPQYAFETASGDGETWAIDKMNSAETERASISVSRMDTPMERAMFSTYRGLAVGLCWLPDMVSNPGFKISDVVEHQGMNRITFSYDHQGEGDSNVRGIQGGELVLDPARHWQISSADIDGHWDYGSSHVVRGKMTIRNEFAKFTKQVQYVKKNEITFVTRSNNRDDQACWTFLVDAEPSRLKPTDSKFRLTGYGLSEPVELAPPKSFGRTKLAVLAAALAAGALFLRRLTSG